MPPGPRYRQYQRRLCNTKPKLLCEEVNCQKILGTLSTHTMGVMQHPLTLVPPDE
jgi:hypothetical protein